MTKVSSEKETIFITGGLGFIGSYLTKLFLADGQNVIVYDLLKSYVSPLRDNLYYEYLKARHKNIGPAVTVIEGDIRDPHRLSETLREYQPDRVIHLAALPIADLSDKYPYEAIDVNFNGTLNLLHAMKNIEDLKRFVYISSSMVYGDFQYRPCDEEHQTRPKEMYGGSKLSAEICTRIFCTRSEISFNIVRPSAVYGPGDCNRRVSQLFVDNAFAGKPLLLHDGGSHELDFTYVEDAAEGIHLAATVPEVEGETFNITRGEGRSLKEFAQILRNYFPKLTVRVEEIPEMKKKSKRGAMDISKARKLLGYNPKVSLEEGISRYVDFIKGVRGLS